MYKSKRKSSIKRRKPSYKPKSLVKRKSSHTRQSINKPMAKFWCMRCKNFSKSKIDRYEKGKNGGTFAKGRCSKCDTKLSLIVKKLD